MQFSKRNNIFLLSTLLWMGCSSSSFQYLKMGRWDSDFLTTPDRVTYGCHDVKNDDGLLFFQTSVLDEKNTAISIILNNLLTKEECRKEIAQIDKVFKNAKMLYFGVHGKLDEDPREDHSKEEDYKVVFPNGKIAYGNGRVGYFRVIQNDQGLCYDMYYGSKKPCPRDEFPVK